MDLASDVFEGHYIGWRRARIDAIKAHYGEGFFAGKTVLELGCGHGQIGEEFLGLGAQVTFAEGRPEHCDVIRKRLPGADVRLVNAEDPWDLGDYDVVLHMGLLYHLAAWQASLIAAMAHSRDLVLECEVMDSDNPLDVITRGEGGYDQAIGGLGSYPSPAFIEAIMSAHGAAFEMVKDARCNGGGHRYDWTLRNTRGVENGQRRFWFVRSGFLGPHRVVAL